MIQCTDQSYRHDEKIYEMVIEVLKILKDDKKKKKLKLNNTMNSSIHILGVCTVCDGPDSDEMLLCEKCSSWIHYQCDETIDKTSDMGNLVYNCLDCRNKKKHTTRLSSRSNSEQSNKTIDQTPEQKKCNLTKAQEMLKKVGESKLAKEKTKYENQIQSLKKGKTDAEEEIKKLKIQILSLQAEINMKDNLEIETEKVSKLDTAERVKDHRLQHRNKQEIITEFVKLEVKIQSITQRADEADRQCEHLKDQLQHRMERLQLVESAERKAQEREGKEIESIINEAKEAEIENTSQIAAVKKRNDDLEKNNNQKQQEIRRMKSSIKNYEERIKQDSNTKEQAVYMRSKLDENCRIKDETINSLQILVEEHKHTINGQNEIRMKLENELQTISVKAYKKLQIPVYNSNIDETALDESSADESIMTWDDDEADQPVEQNQENQSIQPSSSNSTGKIDESTANSHSNQLTSHSLLLQNLDQLTRRTSWLPPKTPNNEEQDSKAPNPQIDENQKRCEEFIRTMGNQIELLTDEQMEALQRCKEFDNGLCVKGRSCRKMHMRNTVNEPTRSSISEEPQMIKTVVNHQGRTGNSSWKRPQRNYNIPCKYYLHGHCKFNESCRYLHSNLESTWETRSRSSEDARTSQMNTTRYTEQRSDESSRVITREASTTIQNERCTEFDKGHCRQGRSCTKRHLQDRTAPTENQQRPSHRRY